MTNPKTSVVIVGGGFGGLYAALSLRKCQDVEVTLIDRKNYHLFQPLLYQVATGGLSPANIAAPLRFILRNQPNARVLLGEVTGFSPSKRELLLCDRVIPYDVLVVAAGSRTNYFGNEEWQAAAPGLKGLDDAREIRRRVLYAFEAAEREEDPTTASKWLTFAVVGGGATGVELAGAIGELARETLPNDFRSIDTRLTRIVLIEGGPRLLPSFPSDLSEKAAASLRRLGVEIWTETLVSTVDSERVVAHRGKTPIELSCRTTLWSAGVKASPLGRALGEKTGVQTDPGGRLPVGPDCTLPGHPEIFVIGDLAHFATNGPDTAPLPGVAPVAMQQGNYVGQTIRRRLQGISSPPFRYRNKGDLATVGRSAAVAKIGRLQFSGFFAWLTWLFVHLLYLVGFQNRIIVVVQWAWNYITWNRSARLISQDLKTGSKSQATPQESSAPKDSVSP